MAFFKTIRTFRRIAYKRYKYQALRGFIFHIHFLTQFGTATMVRSILRGGIGRFFTGILSGMMKDSDRLKDLGKKLDKTMQERRGSPDDNIQEGSAAGLAMRAVTELLVGLLVCMALGWAADKYLGTKPWLMLAGIVLGLAAGVVNVMRLSNSKQANELLGGKGPMPPSVKDDDDED